MLGSCTMQHHRSLGEWNLSSTVMRTVSVMGDTRCGYLPVEAKRNDARCPVELIPLLDSRHPKVLKYQSLHLIPELFRMIFNRWLTRSSMNWNAAIKGMDILIAHNIASLNKNLALTAALYKISQKPKMLRASYSGITTWPGRHRVTNQNCMKVIPGTCCAQPGQE